MDAAHSLLTGARVPARPPSSTGATFTKAMANAGVNIRCIAQGSSERQISICVEKEDCTRALRAAHAALALSNTQSEPLPHLKPAPFLRPSFQPNG